MRRIFFICIYFLCNNLLAQHSISGVIYDACNNQLAGIQISIANKQTISNVEGMFLIENLPDNQYTLEINGLGFKKYTKTILLHTDTYLKINLEEDLQEISSVVIEKRIYNNNSLKNNYLEQNFGGSLLQSIEHISGINSQNIGATLGKPILRGFGLHRATVLVNSSKHEGQQWGVDHGLEIDAFSVEKVTFIKGVSSIKYGNDAIGGVLVTLNNTIPEANTESFKLSLIGRSVNQTVGSFVDYQKRKNSIFYKVKLSLLDFADFKTTTDTIVYLTRRIPLEDSYLKNTAGTQANVFGQIGYTSAKIQSTLSTSANYSKSGFYPGSHGIPTPNRLLDDGNKRNVEYPYQQTLHSMLQHEFQYYFENATLHIENTFQQNNRNEMSLFHTHFPNQQIPEKNPDLEIGFKLNSFSSNLNYEMLNIENHNFNLGIQLSKQDNNISGYSFFLPKYNKSNIGLYILHQTDISDKLTLTSGLRFDYTRLKIDEMYDENLYNYLLSANYDTITAEQYALRSKFLKRSFNNLNYKLAALYKISNRLNAQLEIGSVIRNPTAIELGVNGIHHGAFRHEKGNPELKSERGILFDFRTEYHSDFIHFEINPYFYYFNNYIYLNPTGLFSILPHSGQLYQYTQAKAISSGLECNANINFKPLHFYIATEYIYNKQLNNQFPLPFTPALNIFGRLNYDFNNISIFNKNSNTSLYIDTKYYAAQNRVALNETKTPASLVFGTGLNNTIEFDKNKINLTISIQNLFNTKYFNHNSYYRTLNIPEPSRNIQLLIQYQF